MPKKRSASESGGIESCQAVGILGRNASSIFRVVITPGKVAAWLSSILYSRISFPSWSLQTASCTKERDSSVCILEVITCSYGCGIALYIVLVSCRMELV